jgi:2-dehydro-3-deoxyphosphogluconate aldolase/(4S)-4-hydroxy-2-oxoglutarate aldolase
MNDFFDSVFQGHRLLAVLRGQSIERTLELANAAWDAGIDCVEVTIQTPQAVEALVQTVREARRRGRTAAAGTVTTTEAMESARRAGAAFTVSPGFDLELLEAHRRTSLPHLPGVATASELLRARAAQVRWVKVFPAASLGPSWFSTMKGPFPDMRFVATGGIAPSAVAMYLNAGADVVGIGSAISSPDVLKSLSTMLQSAAELPSAEKS